MFTELTQDEQQDVDKNTTPAAIVVVSKQKEDESKLSLVETADTVNIGKVDDKGKEFRVFIQCEFCNTETYIYDNKGADVSDCCPQCGAQLRRLRQYIWKKGKAVKLNKPPLEHKYCPFNEDGEHEATIKCMGYNKFCENYVCERHYGNWRREHGIIRLWSNGKMCFAANICDRCYGNFKKEHDQCKFVYCVYLCYAICIGGMYYFHVLLSYFHVI